MAEKRLYAIEDNIIFPLIDYGDTDFEDSPVAFEAGDSKIDIDGVGFGNTINLPTHLGEGIYNLVLTAAEQTGKKMAITIKDQSIAPLWEDQAIYIETMGNALAQHPYMGLDPAAAVFAYVAENSKTFLEIVRIMFSALKGKSSGGGTGTHAYRDDADTKPRVVVTVDGNGNRLTSVVDGS